MQIVLAIDRYDEREQGTDNQVSQGNSIKIKIDVEIVIFRFKNGEFLQIDDMCTF